MTGILTNLPADATLDDVRRRMDLANVRYLAQHAATVEDHERLVRQLGEMVIEVQREQMKEDRNAQL